MRRLGDITQDLEDLVAEMVEGHNMQTGEIRAIVKSYLDTHFVEAREQYEDNTEPIDAYGHWESIEQLVKAMKKRRIK